MAWEALFSALALVLIIEGILPFLIPNQWRRSIFILAQQPSHRLRVLGLVMMLAGVVLLYMVKM